MRNCHFLIGLMPEWILRYRGLPRAVFIALGAQFLINLINTAQFLLLNLFMKEQGLDDPEIASLASKRFVATFLLAVPAGLWMRGRLLKKPMVAGAAIFPVMAVAGLEAVRMGWPGAAAWAFFMMGFAGLLLSVASLPMILRLVPKNRASEALSLLFCTWAAAAIFGGAIASGLQWLGSVRLGTLVLPLDVHATLLLLTLAGFGAPFLLVRLPDPEAAERRDRNWLRVRREDRPVLFRVLLPSLCIATGAGLSIQFLNLFFSHVFQMGAATYAAFGTASNVLVLVAGLLVPEVKRRFGWRGAILGVQSVAVVMLVVMGLCEIGSGAAWALPLAVVMLVLRQPLMSMAGPATTELTMAYVGPRNHELVSAFQGAVWSGSWWLAAVIFEKLRGLGMPYWQIFMITAALYALGTAAYAGLIRRVDARPPDAPDEAGVAPFPDKLDAPST